MSETDRLLPLIEKWGGEEAGASRIREAKGPREFFDTAEDSLSHFRRGAAEVFNLIARTIPLRYREQTGKAIRDKRLEAARKTSQLCLRALAAVHIDWKDWLISQGLETDEFNIEWWRDEERDEFVAVRDDRGGESQPDEINYRHKMFRVKHTIKSRMTALETSMRNRLPVLPTLIKRTVLNLERMKKLGFPMAPPLGNQLLRLLKSGKFLQSVHDLADALWEALENSGIGATYDSPSHSRE